VGKQAMDNWPKVAIIVLNWRAGKGPLWYKFREVVHDEEDCKRLR